MEYVCTVCQKKIPGDMIVYLDHTEKHIIDLVKNDHPDWIEKDGICKACAEYYHSEIEGSVFKDAACALRQRKVKGVLGWIGNLFGKKS